MTFFVAMTVTTLLATSPGRDLVDGRQLYESADFAKAALRFGPPCTRDQNAEACYWAGISYERLADTRTPFGCPTYRKARAYLVEAQRLAPAHYRDALFEFLLDTPGCSRSALREAASMVAALPASDPEYDRMRSRLAQAMKWNGATEERLATLFLALPRGAVRSAALPASITGNRRSAAPVERAAGSRKTSRTAPREASRPESVAR